MSVERFYLKSYQHASRNDCGAGGLVGIVVVGGGIVIGCDLAFRTPAASSRLTSPAKTAFDIFIFIKN